MEHRHTKKMKFAMRFMSLLMSATKLCDSGAGLETV